MSTNKPSATATIKFYPNKHVEVELDTIAGITPRTLSIAGNLLQRTYRGMKGKFIADEHAAARKKRADDKVKAKQDDAAWHKKEDERLAGAANAEDPKIDKKPVVEEPAANDDTVAPDDATEIA